MGRPAKWTELDMPSRLESVTGWAKQGSTDEEMCTMLGISTTIFYEWKNKYAEFAEAIKKGKEVSNGELINAAFKLSTGYREVVTEPIKVKKQRFEDGKVLTDEEVEIVEYEKYYAPQPVSNIFMVKNRFKEDYKDKHEVDSNVSGNIEVTFSDPQLDEWAK
jgi:hypothetical protein